MPRTNLFTILLASASLVAASQFSLAAPAGQGKGGGQGKGQERAAKHMHKNMNAKNVLGEPSQRMSTTAKSATWRPAICR